MTQVMAKHGVVVVKNALGRAGTLAMRPGNQVTHFGLTVYWARPQDRANLWASAGLPGVPGRLSGDEVAFFQDLMRALYAIGIQRAVWNEETRVAVVPDQAAPHGFALKLANLQCVAVGEEPQGLHL